MLSSQGVRDFIVRRSEYRKLEAQFGEVQRRVTDKRVRLSRAQKDNEFLEMEARRHLGLVKPGEVEFRFGSDKDQSSEADRPESRRDEH
jgi:cell division protein FtsB